MPEMSNELIIEAEHPHAGRFRQGAQVLEMLLGKNLGGGHQRPLVAALDTGEDGCHGDHGFPRTDIALQQAVHGMGPGHIGADGLDGALLGTGQGKGQPGREAGQQAPDPRVAAKGAVLGARELQAQQQPAQRHRPSLLPARPSFEVSESEMK